MDINTKIDGVEVTTLKIIKDERGAVLHMININSDGFEKFGECYFSEINPNVVKGWKKHFHQTQNLAVPIGEIKLVIYDSRPNSKSYGEVDEIILGRENNYARVKIPKDLWYGFKCISDKSALIANCADLPHDPNDNIIINLDSPIIPYLWEK